MPTDAEIEAGNKAWRELICVANWRAGDMREVIRTILVAAEAVRPQPEAEVVAAALRDINADDPGNYGPIIPPTAIPWIADLIVRALVVPVEGNPTS